MKLIIDLPKKVVTAIQNGEDYRYDIHTAIAQGKPYEERPKGEWKYVQRYNDDAFEFRCSVCGRKIIVDCDTSYALRDFPFCNCGADMRGNTNAPD